MKNTITLMSICFIILFTTNVNAQEFNKKTVKEVNQASELFCS